MTAKSHDRFLRDTFKEREVALEAMRDNLPAELLAIADIEKYELIGESFIDETLSEQISDVLLAIPMKKEAIAGHETGC